MSEHYSKQIQVNFSPAAIGVLEETFTQYIESKIAKYPWADNYYDTIYGQRKFALVFVLGDSHLTIRAAISNFLTLSIQGLNVLPGGQTSLTDKILEKTVISIMERCAPHLRRSDLIARRDLIVFNKEARAIRKKIYDYNIPAQNVFTIPAKECKIVDYTASLTITCKDIITGDQVTVSGTNEPEELVIFKARTKLFSLRELDEDE